MKLFKIERSANGAKKKFFIGGRKVFVYTNKKAYQKYENIMFEKAIWRMSEEIRTLQGIVNSCLDISKLPTARGKLREIQLASFELLKIVDQICKKNKLKYWLDFGSLLGAIRHKGFIPWDDDVDICMLREDYMKILPLLQQHFADTEYTVREFLDDHLQIRIKNLNNSIGLDIFPVDTYNQKKISDEEEQILNSAVKGANSLFISMVRGDKNFAFDITKMRTAIQQMTQELILQNNTECPKKPIMFYGIDYPHTHKNLIIDYKDIFPLQKIKFEDGEFYCPHNPDNRLAKLYGDYMRFPTNFDIWND